VPPDAMKPIRSGLRVSCARANRAPSAAIEIGTASRKRRRFIERHYRRIPFAARLRLSYRSGSIEPHGTYDMGHWITLTAADGATISAWRADPAGKPRGGLVVAQEIFGVNSHIRSVCDGYAAEGYVAIAPALFDRFAPKTDIGYTPEDIEKGRGLKERLGHLPGSAVDDLNALFTPPVQQHDHLTATRREHHRQRHRPYRQCRDDRIEERSRGQSGPGIELVRGIRGGVGRLLAGTAQRGRDGGEKRSGNAENRPSVH